MSAVPSTIVWGADEGSVRVSIGPYGDSAALIETTGDDAESSWRAAQSIRSLLLRAPIRAFVDLVSSYQHVLVQFDPGRTDFATARADVLALLASQEHGAFEAPPRMFTIPAVFGGAFGPDLADVARAVDRTPDELVRTLLAETFTVKFLGAGMEPMSSGLPFERAIPRRSVPRARVEPGSVSVAASSLSIYPFASPGGWQILGRTPLAICDIRRSPPVSYAPGDTIRFAELAESDWTRLAGEFLVADDA